MSNYIESQKSAIRAATFRIILFSILLLAVIACAYFMAVNPKSINETLGFRPLERDASTLNRLNDNYAMLIPLRSAIPIIFSYQSEIEKIKKPYKVKKTNVKLENLGNDNAQQSQLLIPKDQEESSYTSIDTLWRKISSLQKIKELDVDTNIRPTRDKDATKEYERSGKVTQAFIDQYSMEIDVFLKLPEYEKNIIENIGWPRRSAIPVYLDTFAPKEKLLIKSYTLKGSEFFKAVMKDNWEDIVKKDLKEHSSLPYYSIIDYKKQTAYLKKYFSSKDSNEKQEVQSLFINELNGIHLKALNVYKQVLKDEENFQKDIHLIFNQISSDKILYASVVAQRVLVGLLLIAAMIYFLRSIFSDLNLQRALTIGHISKVYSVKDDKFDGDTFNMMFSLFSGASDTNNFNEKKKKDTFSDRVTSVILDSKFIDKVVDLIEKRKPS